MDQRIYLKVKIKSLAAEARIIRREEKKARTWRAGLRDHRVGVVRSEARSTLLAYGLLKGKTYKQLEPSCHTPPDWSRVEKMIRKYGQDWDLQYKERASDIEKKLALLNTWKE